LKQELKGPLNQEQHDYIQRIYDSGEHLLNLLNDILDNAKLEAGRLELRREPTLLEPIIHETLMSATSLILDKPIAFCQEIAPDLPPVYGDRLRIAQVLLNLLSNAVKFTNEGSVTLRAYARQVDRDDPSKEIAPDALLKERGVWQVVVEVADTGIGIAAENLSLIFEEYRQADATLSRRYGGTGLGLPISKRLVELHDGELTVISVLGQGSTFRFTLPIASTEQLKPVPVQQEEDVE
jgi:signal transduction histidine kinase